MPFCKTLQSRCFNGITTPIGASLEASVLRRKPTNFLPILQAKHQDYHLNKVALAYFEAQGLRLKYMNVLKSDLGLVLEDEAALKQYFTGP